VLIPLILLFYDLKAFKIDYFLIATFLSFFGFTDNLKKMVSVYLTDSNSVFLHSLWLSQVISNVPTTCLLVDFTKNYKALLIGVNLGGLGTLMASFANIIGYRFISFGERKKFLLIFHILNFLLLVAGTGLWFLLQK